MTEDTNQNDRVIHNYRDFEGGLVDLAVSENDSNSTPQNTYRFLTGILGYPPTPEQIDKFKPPTVDNFSNYEDE